MKKIIILIILTGVFIGLYSIAGSYHGRKKWFKSGSLYAQENPFEPQLPKKMLPVEPGKLPTPEENLPELSIEGVLWGTKIPQAIIEGEVYKEGDVLNNLDVKIKRIEGNTVIFLYKDREFIRSVNR
ncbi:MAG: hypothetical protein ABH872_06525 [Candidatus Omnitrophota bacterium]